MGRHGHCGSFERLRQTVRRLPVSVPRTTGQLPVYYNARASYDVMRYRDLENTPLYPFGFGLHYTTFKTTVKDGTPEISIAALENGKAHTVTCEVENTGSTAAMRRCSCTFRA